LLMSLPSDEARDAREVGLRTSLGVALIATRGFAALDVEQNYERAYALCENAGDVPLPILYGVWAVYLLRADLEKTAAIARRLERILETSSDRTCQLIACACLGVRRFFLGEFTVAQQLFERAIQYCDLQNPAAQIAELQRDYGFDGYIYPFSYGAYCLTLRGFPDRGRELSAQARRLAELAADPYTIAGALGSGGDLALECFDDVTMTRELATRQMAIAAENDFAFWHAFGLFQCGVCDVRSGHAESGCAQIEASNAALRSLGEQLIWPGHLRFQAHALIVLGKLDRALATIEEGIAALQGRLGMSSLPPLLKAKGDVLTARGDHEAAEAEYRRARELLIQQDNKLYALHTTIPLARWLAQSGRRAEAHALLAASDAGMSEGFDLPDRITARALLNEFAPLGADPDGRAKS
jgi:tetratricopeptide (TPR) repeat protein